MVQIVLIGLGAGVASALLFASIASGSPISILLFYLAPLPILLAGDRLEPYRSFDRSTRRRGRPRGFVRLLVLHRPLRGRRRSRLSTCLCGDARAAHADRGARVVSGRQARAVERRDRGDFDRVHDSRVRRRSRFLPRDGETDFRARHAPAARHACRRAVEIAERRRCQCHARSPRHRDAAHRRGDRDADDPLQSVAGGEGSRGCRESSRGRGRS